MNKQVQLLLIMMLVLALTACGETKTSPQADSTKVSEAAETQTDRETASAQEENDQSMTEFEITEIPSEYEADADQAGQIVRFDYETGEENKYA